MYGLRTEDDESSSRLLLSDRLDCDGAHADVYSRLVLPQWRLMMLTSALAGCQLCFAIQIGYGTTTFKELGMSPRYISLVWLAGPISGIIVQPIVGSLSDRCTSPYGRRKPFIFYGWVCIVVALLGFSNAEALGLWISSSHGADVGCTIAIVMFWLLDFAVNTVQGPIRTLATDIVHPSQQDACNAWFASMTGIANCLGSFLGSLPLVVLFPLFFDAAPRALHLRRLHCDVHNLDVLDVYRRTTRATPLGTLDLDRGVQGVRVCIALVSFAMRESFHHPSVCVVCVVLAVHFRHPVDGGAIFYSCMLPSLTRRFTRKYCYIFSQVVLGASLLSMLFLDEGQNALAVFLFAVLGIPWATTMTIPWTIVALAVSHLSTVGLYLTTFNLSQCFPEILVSLIGEVIIAETDAPALVLALGGVSALVSAALIPVLGATDLSMLDHTLSDEESNPPLSRVRLHSFPPSVPQATTDAGFDAPMGYDGEHTSPTTRSRVQPIERSGISPSPSPSSSPTAPLIHSSLPRRTE
eukprot:Rmarinus@m.5584